MSSGVTLNAATRQNLLSLQGTAELVATTQNRLATGKKVNTALDNPTSFFTASALTSRSSNLSSLLDGIGNGIQTIQAANTGLSKLQSLTSQLKSTAQQALASTNAFTAKATATSTALSGATASNLLSTGATVATATAALGTLSGGNAPSAPVPAALTGSVDYKPTASATKMSGAVYTPTVSTVASATGGLFTGPANAVAGTAVGGTYAAPATGSTLSITSGTGAAITVIFRDGTGLTTDNSSTIDLAVAAIQAQLTTALSTVTVAKGAAGTANAGKIVFTGATNGDGLTLQSNAAGIGFGPRVIVSRAALDATGLVQPGSLNRWSYRLQLPEASDAEIERRAAAIAAAAPDAGWEMRARSNADPRFAKSIERFTQFLTLVGLTALIVGGVGVGNAVAAFVERKRGSIATLKSVGAPGGQVVALYLTQVMLIAGLATAIGLGLGAGLPFAVDALFHEALPLPLNPTVAPGELTLAAAYGLLTALAFAILPLGRAHDIPVSGLFRDVVDPGSVKTRLRYRLILGAALSSLVGLAVVTAFDRRLALIFIAAAAIAFGLLRLVAFGLMALARRLPRPRSAAPRLALANLHRPGALTPAIVLSLGLGVTLLVALSLIDANVRNTLNRSLPARAPNLFFLDIPAADADGFHAFLGVQAPGAKIERVPMMRGRITALDGVPVAAIKPPEDAAWVLDGDRGITYAEDIPEGSRLVAGTWWTAEQARTPLVSFDAELARSLNLSVGGTVTVNVLGRTLEAKIANLRKVEWRSLGINFVMVFSPGTFRGAPHSDLATLTLPNGPDAKAEAVILRDVARAYPSVTSIRVKEALEAVNDVVGKLVLAIRGASGIAVVASLFVLAGALAAGHRARLYDAVVLKVLGATRGRLLAAYVLEYGALGIATAVFGVLAGTLAGWIIVTRVMKLEFTTDLSGALIVAAVAVVFAIGLGLAGTWRILGRKPASYLRQL